MSEPHLVYVNPCDLPEDDREVLCLNSAGSFYLCRYDSEYRAFDDSSECFKREGIVAWWNLPELEVLP
jgi:hypothetical protein